MGIERRIWRSGGLREDLGSCSDVASELLLCVRSISEGLGQGLGVRRAELLIGSLIFEYSHEMPREGKEKEKKRKKKEPYLFDWLHRPIKLTTHLRKSGK